MFIQYDVQFPFHSRYPFSIDRRFLGGSCLKIFLLNYNYFGLYLWIRQLEREKKAGRKRRGKTCRKWPDTNSNPEPGALLNIKLYWGTGPYSYPFKLAAHNALLGYKNSPCLTNYTTVQGCKFDISFCRDIVNASVHQAAFIWVEIQFFWASCNIIFMF